MSINTENRLVIVSNRLPYTLRWADGAWTRERSGGGLVTALSASPRRRRLWIGWPGGELHTPFPDPEAFLLIPQHEALLRGLLGADSVCVQTEADRARFRETVERALGAPTTADAVTFAGRTVRLAAAGAGADGWSCSR